MTNKKVREFFLAGYDECSLEVKKKSSVLLVTLFCLIFSCIVISIIEFLLKFPLVALLPLFLGIFFSIVVLVLLKLNYYNVAVGIFVFASMIVITAFSLFDPYPDIFELYRYSFSLLFIMIFMSAITCNKWHLIISTIMGDLGIIGVYYYKVVICTSSTSDVKINIATLFACLVLYSVSGSISTFVLMLTKKIIHEAEYNEKLAKDQRDSFSRFVPREFLSLLNKNSIIDIQLGDNLEQEMTIIFTDIRDFTSLSETMNPRENFDFINSYLSHMEPVINKNHGFIDKYVGDSIISLFPHNSKYAINCGIEMLAELKKFNENRKYPGVDEIKVGIGINTGNLMLGTIGSANRMDGTVISDAVNTASRLESLTKLYNASILVSQDTFNKLPNPDDFHYRFLDQVKVKGKDKSIGVYEILNGLHEEELRLKLATKAQFEKGIHEYNNRNISAAGTYFNEVLKINKNDRAAEIYSQRCARLLIEGIPDNWDGITMLDEK